MASNQGNASIRLCARLVADFVQRRLGVEIEHRCRHRFGAAPVRDRRSAPAATRSRSADRPAPRRHRSRGTRRRSRARPAAGWSSACRRPSRERGLGVEQVHVRALVQQPLARAVVGTVVEHQEAVDAHVPGSRPAARAGGPARCARAGRRGSRLSAAGRGCGSRRLDRVRPAMDARVVGRDPCPPRPGALDGAVLPIEAGEAPLHLAVRRQLSARVAQDGPRRFVSAGRHGDVEGREPSQQVARMGREQRLAMAGGGVHVAMAQGQLGQLQERLDPPGQGGARLEHGQPRRVEPAQRLGHQMRGRDGCAAGWVPVATAAAAASAASSASPSSARVLASPSRAATCPGAEVEHLLEMVAGGRKVAAAVRPARPAARRGSSACGDAAARSR